MPIFDFRCDGCGSTEEQLVRAGWNPEPCGHCGSIAVVKLVGAAVVRPAGIAPEVAPPESKKGRMPKGARKNDGRTTIGRVTKRILDGSRQPGGKPMTVDQARAIATRTRVRKERRRNR